MTEDKRHKLSVVRARMTEDKRHKLSVESEHTYSFLSNLKSSLYSRTVLSIVLTTASEPSLGQVNAQSSVCMCVCVCLCACACVHMHECM